MMWAPFATCETNSRAAVMPSGARFDLGTAPDPATIALGDIAMALATRKAMAVRHGLSYSVAQRAVMLADALGREEPLWGCYGLMHFAPLAFGGWPDAQFVNAAGNGAMTAFATMWVRTAEAVHEAFDLDWPVPEAIAAPLMLAVDRLHLSELISLGAGVDREIREYQLRGVRPLVRRIAPLAADKAYEKFFDGWWLYAARAGLRESRTWRAVA